MTIATNNLKQMGCPKTEQQQNKQHAVKDWGKPAGSTELPVPVMDKLSAKATETATWKNPRFNTPKTSPLGKDKSRATATKTVTWKTSIVDTSKTPLSEIDMNAEDAFNTVQSKYNKTFKGCMWPSPCIWHHPAYKTLFKYATDGCPIVCDESWSWEWLEAAIQRGNHASAQELQAEKCLCEEALEKEQQGSAWVVKWADICNGPHPNLKISLLAAIPHKSRIYWTILDLNE